MSPLFKALTALLIVLSLAVPATSGPASGDQSVRFLYPIGKVYKNEAVVPIVVEFSNTTTRERTFVTTWPLSNPVPANLASVRLKAGERRRIPLVLPRHIISQLYSLEVNGQSYSLDLQTDAQSPTVAVLSPSEDKFDYLRALKLQPDPNAAVQNPSGQATPVAEGAVASRIALNSLTNLEPDLLPENWASLFSLDTIVVYDLPALSLSQRQKQALMDWTLRGGRLVLVADGDPAGFRGTPFEPFLPMECDNVVTDGGLTQLTGKLRPKAKALSSWKGRPLLAARPALNGTVYLVTAPLKEMAPLSSEQSESLWRQVLPPPPNFNQSNNYQSYNPVYNSYGSGYNNPTSNHLVDIPEMPRAQAGWLALYLLAYAIIVGPINLSFLRRRDKMLWSFVTVPTVAIVFAGGAYLINYLNRSSVPIYRELGVVRFESSNPFGSGTSEGLFFSPSSQTYTFDCDPASICYGVQDYRSTLNSFGMYSPLPNGGLQSTLNLSTWDISTLTTDSIFKLPTPVEGRWKNNVLTINSPLPCAPNEAILYHRSKGATASFTLKGGKQTENLAFNANSTYNSFSAISSTTKEHPGRDSLLGSLSGGATQFFKEDAVYLIFWTDSLKAPIGMGPQTVHKAEYLVMVELES